MRTIADDLYERTKDEIANRDVPAILQTAWLKQLLSVISFENSISRHIKDETGAQLMRINFYKMTFKQYNTVISLARGTKYIVDPEVSYLDITTIFTIIRSCYERYLCFWHLGTPLSCWRVSPEQELKFRWLCFYHSGIADEQKIFRLLGELRDTSAFSKDLKEQKEKRRRVLEKIRNHSIFRVLDNETRLKIEKHGAWRIGAKGEMSWSQLGNLSPIHSATAQYEYHMMGQYAHPTYRGIAIDGNNNVLNINNDLAFLYSIAAMFIAEMTEIIPDSDKDFTVRELTIVRELKEIAMNSIPLPPINAENACHTDHQA